MENSNSRKRHPMEILWICLAVVTLLMAINSSIQQGLWEAWPLYAFAAVSMLMFAWRRSLRKKEEGGSRG